MPSVIVLDPLSQEGLDLLAAAPRISFDVRTGLKGADLREALAQFDGAICRSGVKITADVLEGNRRLKAIVRAGVGTDNIDSKAATRAGIVVMNTPAGNTLSTAEHAITLMLALSRNVAPAYRSLCEGRWDRSKYMGVQVAGKSLGVVGLGRIGVAVAKRALALEMKVLGFDPFMSKEKAKELGVELVDRVDDMLPLVDYLTVHTPLTDETRHMIGREQLDRLKPGVRLINAARGGIYDEAALVDGLKSGRIAGVALDVFAEEPCTSSPLFGMPGVLCTPHLGASTEEAQNQVAVEAVALLTDFLSTGQIKNAVNIAALDAKTLDSLRGFLDVSYRLGRLAAGLMPTGLKTCRIQYRGEIADRDTKVLTSAFAAGMLESALDESANLVNASVLLGERGIALASESRTDMGAFRSSMSIELVDASGDIRRAAGTVFGQTMPRLISLDGYKLEAYLDGFLLVFTHRDVPGIIGGVGTVFGQHQVNIAQMAVGRAGEAGGDAVGVLNLDAEPPAAALEAVRQLPAISSATVIRLPQPGQLPAWLQS